MRQVFALYLGMGATALCVYLGWRCWLVPASLVCLAVWALVINYTVAWQEAHNLPALPASEPALPALPGLPYQADLEE